MTLHKIKPLPLALLLALFAPTAALAEDELCGKSFTWFSCELDNSKTVAICGSPSTNVDQPTFGADADAWLQYRYGTSDKIELKYPEGQGNQLWKQFMAGIEFNPGGTPNRINLSFITDGIRYLIQGNQVPFTGKMTYALSVVDEGAIKTIAEHKCSGFTYDANFLAAAIAVPCDPNDAGNATRGEDCN